MFKALYSVLSMIYQQRNQKCITNTTLLPTTHIHKTLVQGKSMEQLEYRNRILYTQKFLQYVNFTDFMVSKATVKIQSMKNCHSCRSVEEQDGSNLLVFADIMYTRMFGNLLHM